MAFWCIFFRSSVVAVIWLTLVVRLDAAVTARQRLRMDFDWRFHLGEIEGVDSTAFAYPEVNDLTKTTKQDVEQAAELAKTRRPLPPAEVSAKLAVLRDGYDDRGWCALDLPHDWAVELPFDPRATKDHGYKAIGPGLGNTIGWYRKTFSLPATDTGGALWLEFDGVFRNCLVWLNGVCLGRNIGGYSSFHYDIARAARFGGTNTLVVRVDASRHEGWFYEGAGIYRHVWLVKAPPLHVAHWGTYVVSTVTNGDAELSVETTVRNDSDRPASGALDSAIDDGDEAAVASAEPLAFDAPPHAEVTLTQKIPLKNAHLWSPDMPYLYRLISRVRASAGNGVGEDRYETPFGVRTLRFDPEEGFFLNGQRVEIKGTCNHQDHAGVGTALPDRLQSFRVVKLKAMGSNAYRASHHPPTPELLDACDRLGMLVMDENRRIDATPETLDDVERMVRRDRNHPCVFIWSIANEETKDDMQGEDWGAAIARGLSDRIHQLDASRPVTAAMNGKWGDGFSKVIDVQGFNYVKKGGADEFHDAFPNQPAIGTEDASTLATRGIYENDEKRGFLSAYDVNAPDWGLTAEAWWKYYLDRPWAAGAFVWTGFDYRGEPTPFNWPAVSSQFGVMDICGFPKDDYFFYQAWWSNQPVLHILPRWTWPGCEGQEISVWVHSNYDSVELLLNGRSLGRQTMPRNSHLEWKVPYAPGVLEARGYLGDVPSGSEKVETTGAPAKLNLDADRTMLDADGEDVAVVTVSILDQEGRAVPTADNRVEFSLEGQGRIIGVGNGDPTSHEKDQASERRLFNGLAEVIVKTTRMAGPIRLTARADGVAAAELKLFARQP